MQVKHFAEMIHQSLESNYSEIIFICIEVPPVFKNACLIFEILVTDTYFRKIILYQLSMENVFLAFCTIYAPVNTLHNQAYTYSVQDWTIRLPNRKASSPAYITKSSPQHSEPGRCICIYLIIAYMYGALIGF